MAEGTGALELTPAERRLVECYRSIGDDGRRISLSGYAELLARGGDGQGGDMPCPLCRGKRRVSLLVGYDWLDKDDMESFARHEVGFRVSGSGLAGAEHQSADVYLRWFPYGKEHYDRREPLREEHHGPLRYCPCCGDELRNDLDDAVKPHREP